MESIGIRDLQTNPGRVLSDLKDSGESMLVTKNGKPAALLTPIDEDAYEDFILSNAPVFVEGMRQAEKEFNDGKTISLSDALDEINDAD